ncbi:MAG: hypothetical protein EHM45_20065 [Desulfobacteraceae bacterium]|nr:MAG: hypothetical protein EHM45_20065 [Desulfobacteraceae bacterium]
MKPLFLQVYFFDPKTKQEFLISDGIAVDVVNVKTATPDRLEYLDPLNLAWDAEARVFHVDAPDYALTRTHTIRVSFLKPRFSMPLKKLVSATEIGPELWPVLYPARLPYLDTEWQTFYRTAKYYGSKEKPVTLKVPFFPIYNIAHRGAPYHHPENTLAAFKKALDLGANGLELDLCLTADERIIVFHDPKPVNLISPINRINVENLPYGIISPKFVPRNDGLYAVMVKYIEGRYTEIPCKDPLKSLDEYDIEHLTLNQIREIYRYRHTPDHVEYEIPTFEEFLDFVQTETRQNPNRLPFVYFDVKDPGWNEKKETEKFVAFGTRIGHIIDQYPELPEILVIGYTDPKGLEPLKRGIEQSGEQRCQFAYDAPGSLAALVEALPHNFMKLLLAGLLGKPAGALLVSFLGKILRRILSWVAGRNINPLKTALNMRLSVLAIGCLGRPQNLEEVREAVEDRDYNPESPLKIIAHYTLNDADQIKASLALGVNGIMTDKPDEFGKALERSILSAK